MINSVKKGKSFENWTAKYLTRTTGHRWIRTPHSGAYATIHDIKSQKGDVYSPDDDEIYIECKAIKELGINELFKKNNIINRWMSKAKKQTDRPVAIFIKINNKGVFVAFKENIVIPIIKLTSHECIMIEGLITIIKL